MQFSTVFVSAAALFMGASASPITRDTHIADFRLYGKAGCSAQNLGIWTVLDDALDKCTPFNDVVKAVTLEDSTKGCKCRTREILFWMSWLTCDSLGLL